MLFPVQYRLDLQEGSRLVTVRDHLRRAYGSPGGFVALDPVSQLVRSSISSRTLDETSWAAFHRLADAFADWNALADADPVEVEVRLRDVRWPGDKAARLSEALRRIRSQRGALELTFLKTWSVEAAHAWLEALPNVGPKVAAAVLNFSTLGMRLLVIDTHVLRIARRAGLVPARAETRAAHRLMMGSAPDSWEAGDLLELHVLMKRLGQEICRHGAPACGSCPLGTLCPGASANSGVAAQSGLIRSASTTQPSGRRRQTRM